MLKLASLIWSILAVAFAGALIIVVLNVPTPAQEDMRAIPIAAAIGALLAIPAAIYVAKRIMALTKQ
ncbi:hypothetical protein [Xanthobacter agilis]|jgi:hypothetical protein|uniref:RDD family membrane protein YckC n=1 Tax=Xanthobacter agilis TaxID=47492 RepID=A0ABU0LEC9_XANAG|nr:hypothetical protein [Xanthobacter agilis]MDQ0505491.1 putative RDD family membrane protein YckC [Xanthobacter agilis]